MVLRRKQEMLDILDFNSEFEEEKEVQVVEPDDLV